jgi:signal transduction histidine kinase
MMKRQVGHMARLIDDLLDVSRVTEGKIELRKTRCDLGVAITRAVEANQPLREKLGHKLLIVKSGRPVHVVADVTRLTQIISNLLTNACKFTDRGGQIFLSVQSDNTHAVIRVRDTGIGMSRAQIPKLFELFSQADTSLARAESGLGIGLAVVKRLVEMHGGTIAASSPGLGQGSEFVVRLPLDADSFAPMPEAASDTRHNTPVRPNGLH